METHNLLNDSEIPMGLGMALAKNPTAMQVFSALPPEGKAAVIERTHTVASKREMEQLVRNIGERHTP